MIMIELIWYSTYIVRECTISSSSGKLKPQSNVRKDKVTAHTPDRARLPGLHGSTSAGSVKCRILNGKQKESVLCLVSVHISLQQTRQASIADITTAKLISLSEIPLY